VPDVALELHSRRHERVVLREFELRRKDAAFVWRALGALDHGLPEEKVILVDRACCDALWWIGCEVLVLLEEALGGYRVHDDGGRRFLEAGPGCECYAGPEDLLSRCPVEYVFICMRQAASDFIPYCSVFLGVCRAGLSQQASLFLSLLLLCTRTISTKTLLVSRILYQTREATLLFTNLRLLSVYY
jgi:hypothetical protein